LQNFLPNISCPDDLSSKLNIQVKPVEPVLEAGAQIQQLVNAECIEDFTGECMSVHHREVLKFLKEYFVLKN
jgi:hypothetical protein